MTRPAFTGAVLTGGRSSRMGTDKAFVEIEGVPLAVLARHALLAAGAAEVLAVGGDAARLETLGFRWVADDHPGAGPLGGIVTALRHAEHDVVVVVGCDMPGLTAAGLGAVVDALEPGDAAAVPLHEGRLEPLHAVYRRRALDSLVGAFAAGERAPHRALARLDVRQVTLEDPASLRNVNTPSDLP